MIPCLDKCLGDIMALQKLSFKPGVNTEVTSYSNESGWVDSDKVRFRAGFPEKIGGWQSISNYTFQGICRSLWSWRTLANANLLALGTNLKFYIEQGGAYYDVTPIRASESLTDPFATTDGSAIVTVTDSAGGFTDGDFVTFSGASAVGGITLDGEYQLTYLTSTTYTVTADSNATSTTTGGGSVTAAYQLNTGTEITTALTGWGAGGWGLGTWGTGGTTAQSLGIWTQGNFGEDLLFGPKGGGIYLWDASSGTSTRGVAVSGLVGASSVPTIQNGLLVSDLSRFVFVIGCNPFGSSVQDPMLIRWSDQEDYLEWSPAATNQAGSLLFSRGSELITLMQSRQEVLVWSDSALYVLQYVEPPVVWSSQLVGENISIASSNAAAYANGTVYWMGKDKFYVYDGRTQTLPCSVRRFIFSDLNTDQYEQVCAGTNEGFHEVWWHYCSKDSSVVDKYVIYNYLEKTWYFGTMGRTAWLDTGEINSPIAATNNNRLVVQEIGCDDLETSTPTAISSYITSGQFDLDDGNRFSFVWRLLPDLNFEGSSSNNPSLDMSLLPLSNSGSGYNSPRSVGGSNTGSVARSSVVPIEAYTNQVNVRVRGRQMSIKLESSAEGVKWQLGSPRLDIRPDGGR